MVFDGLELAAHSRIRFPLRRLVKGRSILAPILQVLADATSEVTGRSCGQSHQGGRLLSQIRRSMGDPRAAWCMTMAIDEQIQNRLLLAQRLLVLEIEHRDRVRAEQLDDADAEKAVRLRQACIERIRQVIARRHPTIQLRAG